MESAYRTNWADAFSVVRDDHVLLISGTGFDFRTHLAQCRITMFRLLDGAWRRSDVSYDARDLGMSGQLGQGRTFVVTRRS